MQWQANAAGIALRFPPAHPFNPLAALRLCIAVGSSWVAVEAIFDHLWRDGRAGTNAAQLRDVGPAIGVDDIETTIGMPEVKSQLRANTDAAIAAGLFGMPTLRMDGELFWGDDASPMIEDWLSNPQRFDSDEYRRIATLPVDVQRKR